MIYKLVTDGRRAEFFQYVTPNAKYGTLRVLSISNSLNLVKLDQIELMLLHYHFNHPCATSLIKGECFTELSVTPDSTA